MRQRFGKCGSRNRFDQCDVPVADGSAYVYSRTRLESSIGGSPLVLVEGLDHVMRLGQSLPQTERKGQLGIRQMTQNLPGAPLSRSKGVLRAIRTQRVQQGAEARVCRRNHRERIPLS